MINEINLSNDDLEVDNPYHIPPKANQIASEITVTIKDDEKTLRSKYLMYQEYLVSYEDETIKRCIAESLKSFDGEPTDVKIRINLAL